MMRASARAKLGQEHEAFADLSVAYRLRPSDLATRSALAEMRARIGDLDAAEREYTSILDAAPQHLESQIGRAEVLVSLAERLADRELLQDAIRQFSSAIDLA